MRHQSGMTLIELMVVVAIAALALGTTLVYSMQWFAKETSNGAAKDVAAFLQLAKIEAISRNREVRFVVDPGTGRLEVWDAAGTTGDLTDDELLHSRAISNAVRFVRPDQTSNEITMSPIAGTDGFQAMFTSDGIVSSGNGAVHMQGGEQFCRVTVFVAGGVAVEYWDGSGWEAGS